MAFLRFLPPAPTRAALTAAALALHASRAAALDPRLRLDRLRYFSEHTATKFLEWCQIYLSHAFPLAFGDHHRAIAESLLLKGQTVEVLIPRGYGKTTEIDAFDLYAICNGFDKHVIRFEHDSREGAKKGVLMARELSGNPAIVADYRLTPGQIWRPNMGEIEVYNHNNPFAAQAQTFFRAIGVLNISRGTTYNFGRIDRAMLNDVVAGHGEAVSAAHNNFLEHLIKEDVGFSGGGQADHPVSIYLITTIQAKGDISDRLRHDATVIVLETPAIAGRAEDVLAFVEFVSSDMRQIRAMIDAIQGTPEAGFTGKSVTQADFAAYCAASPEYQAWFTLLRSTWEAQFPMHKHVREIFRNGSAAFLQEKQHITGDSAFQKYFESWFQAYEELPTHGAREFGVAIDPAGEPRDGTDPVVVLSGCLITAPQQDSSDLYLLECYCDQGTPANIVYQTYQQAHQIARQYGVPLADISVNIEGQIGDCSLFTSFDEIRQKELALGDAANYLDGTPRPAVYCDSAYWTDLWLRGVKQSVNKIVRLLDFRVVAEQGRLHVQPERHALLLRQFLNFAGEQTHKKLPLDRKIDIPDMTEMLFRQLTKLSGDSSPAFVN